MKELTDTQHKVFVFVKAQLLAGRSAPSQWEICEKFGWTSARAAACHIDAIVEKGFLRADKGKARSLRLPRSQEPVRYEVTEIPLFGSIPAGFGTDKEQESDECIAVAVESLNFKPTRHTFALRVSGDSMIGRQICDGDIIILEHGQEPRNGQIVAALVDRKSTLKTFVQKGGKTYLKAENPQYPNLIPSEELVIQGVFRALIRRARD